MAVLKARLQALQAQVEPHFLFNTLAAVEHLIETDPPRAAKMQGNLIGYLRSVMPNLRKPDSTVGREVDICRHYLEILRMQFSMVWNPKRKAGKSKSRRKSATGIWSS